MLFVVSGIVISTIALIGLTLYVGEPVSKKFAVWFRPTVRYEPIDASSLSETLADFANESHSQLVAAQFDLVGYFTLRDACSGDCEGFEGLWINSERDVLAKAAALRIAPSDTLTFFSITSTGLELATSNFGIPQTTALPEFYKSLRCPELRNAAHLLQVHLNRVKLHRSAESLRKFSADEVAELNQRLYDENLKFQVEAGRLWHDKVADVLRPTWRGAFRMIWAQRWPWKTAFWKSQVAELDAIEGNLRNEIIPNSNKPATK